MKYTIEQLQRLDWSKCKLEPVDGREVKVWEDSGPPFGIEIVFDLMWYAHLMISGEWVFAERVADLNREGLTSLIARTHEIDRFIERNLVEKKKVRVIHCTFFNDTYNVDFEVIGSVERVNYGRTLSRPTIEELQQLRPEYDFTDAFYLVHERVKVVRCIMTRCLHNPYHIRFYVCGLDAPVDTTFSSSPTRTSLANHYPEYDWSTAVLILQGT